jgi:hypothetical protein
MSYQQPPQPAAVLIATVFLCTLLTGCKSNDQGSPIVAQPETGAAENEDAPGVVGHFRYMADAARFQACGEDVEYPVTTEGDNARLERAYLDTATKPAEKLLVRFEGSLTWQPKFDPTSGRAGEKEQAWYVELFLGLDANGSCP